MEPHDNDAPDIDYPQLRDQIIDALRALRVGISIDPFNSPTQAHDQIPLLAGALSGVLDLRSMAAIDADDSHAHQQWMAGYHYAITGVQEDNAEGAHYCLGIIAARLQLTWPVTEFLGRRYHTYGTVAATLIEVAANFAAAASAGLENPEGFDPDVLAHFHQLSRRAITLATAALDSAEAHLRDTDYNIDTRN